MYHVQAQSVGGMVESVRSVQSDNFVPCTGTEYRWCGGECQVGTSRKLCTDGELFGLPLPMVLGVLSVRRPSVQVDIWTQISLLSSYVTLYNKKRN